MEEDWLVLRDHVVIVPTPPFLAKCTKCGIGHNRVLLLVSIFGPGGKKWTENPKYGNMDAVSNFCNPCYDALSSEDKSEEVRRATMWAATKGTVYRAAQNGRQHRRVRSIPEELFLEGRLDK